MPSDTEKWYSRATSGHKHGHSTKPRPNGCVSDGLKRLEHWREVEQESDSYQYEQGQECDGDEVFAVKGKGKGGFRGTCFKCGMRGHKS